LAERNGRSPSGAAQHETNPTPAGSGRASGR
jgi:hypothetical protein